MKLIYRSVSYELLLLVVETVEGKVGGKYRGLDWRFHNLKKPLLLQPPVNLTYRGVTYANRPTATPETVPTGQNIQEQARWLMLNKEKAARNPAESMLRRSAHEVGLVPLRVSQKSKVKSMGAIGKSWFLTERSPYIKKKNINDKKANK